MQTNDRVKIFPSLLAADFGSLSRSVGSLDATSADAVHCDVMDGRFVPNISFGPMVVKAVKPHTRLPLCCHLMIEQPENYIDEFVEAGAVEISVHAEACVHLHRVIQQIKATGIHAGVALNPSTPLCMVENIISDLDMLLIMTVNPGFGGQRFIPEMLSKIAQARQLADEFNPELDIAVDGGIDASTAPSVVEVGANILIAGTAVFGHPDGVVAACSELRDVTARI